MAIVCSHRSCWSMCAWFVSVFVVLVLLSTQVAHANDLDNTSADNIGENKAIIELAPLLADKKTRSEALDRLTASAAPRARVWLDALLEGELYILCLLYTSPSPRDS